LVEIRVRGSERVDDDGNEASQVMDLNGVGQCTREQTGTQSSSTRVVLVFFSIAPIAL
jgi:hypothetical protein